VVTTCSVMRTCVPRTVRMRSNSVPPLVTGGGATAWRLDGHPFW
jgi:hypothetical protein